MPKPASPSAPKRLWELDFLRGIALLGMLSFHFLFDLKYWGVHPAIIALKDWPEMFWEVYSTAVAVSFLSLAGVSATVRAAQLRSHRLKTFRKPALRVFAAAGVVTVSSLIFYRTWPIYFGILHCIGASLLLMPWLLPLRNWNFVVGAAMIALGVWMNNQPVPFPWLIWLGLKPSPFPMGDYFSIFPWTGVVALGVGISAFLRLPTRDRWLNSRWEPYRFSRALCFMGRHSLVIYLVHQPIVLGISTLLGLTRFSI